MLKFICFGIISVCGTMIGLECRRKLSVRLHSLIMFRDIFTEMRAMISYNAYTLNEIISELEDIHSDNKFISKLSDCMSHQSVKLGWKNTIQVMCSELCLNEYDLQYLCGCVEKMGRTDLDNELDLFDILISQMSDKIREADDKLKSNGKIYATIGSACGIITALIII